MRSASNDTPRDRPGQPGIEGRDISGPTTDEAMTRSEEQPRVGTEQRESGRARLRKHIVTENVSTTVPVSHEEVTVERKPITDANRGGAMSGPDLSEEEHKLSLTDERATVHKETARSSGSAWAPRPSPTSSRSTRPPAISRSRPRASTPASATGTRTDTPGPPERRARNPGNELPERGGRELRRALLPRPAHRHEQQK